MKNNIEKSRYELEMNGEVAYADYKLDNNILSIKYVFAPPALRGTGAAGNLMKEIMDHARSESLKVIPICGYAASWIKRHDEYADLVK